MSKTRCQICGRNKHVRKNGGLVAHFVGGDPCHGAGHPPIEVSDARLISYVAEVEEAYQAVRAEIKALEDRRANWVDPSLFVRRGRLAALAGKISGRLRRHRAWPERYRRSIERQMYLYGYAYADPPPAYLTTISD